MDLCALRTLRIIIHFGLKYCLSSRFYFMDYIVRMQLACTGSMS